MAHTAVVLTAPGAAQITRLTDAELPEGDVLVDVRWSSLNYKDGLAVTGKGRIARSLPMTCGIDLAGVVAESSSPAVAVGDDVVVTGCGLSETRPGGYTQRQRVGSSIITQRPEALSLQQCMAIGTAGLTAMLAVLALERAGLVPGEREVVVTGAGGGVGSIAVALLAGLGYRVAASTGRAETHEHLKALGATTILDRVDLATAGRPLDKERWAGGIDTVGSQTLASVLAQTAYGGAVAACGLAGGPDLPATVLPFILRGVGLLGIDSVQCPAALRIHAWQRLAQDLDLDALDRMTHVEPMSDVLALGRRILAGQVEGRTVIDVHA